MKFNFDYVRQMLANAQVNKLLLTLFDDRSKAIDDCNGQHNSYQEEYVEYNKRSYETGMWLFLAISAATHGTTKDQR